MAIFGQGFASMSAPSKELERLTIENAFDHGGHPLLERHARAATVNTNPAGDIKPDKSGAKMRIDGILGAVMAIGLAISAGRDVIPDHVVDQMMVG